MDKVTWRRSILSMILHPQYCHYIPCYTQYSHGPCVSQGTPEKQNQWDMCVCIYIYREREREREIYFKECLMQSWGLTGLKPSGQVSMLENLGSVNVAAQVQRQSRSRIPSSSGNFRLFSLKAFNWLDEADPHNAAYPALLKVYWFKC